MNSPNTIKTGSAKVVEKASSLTDADIKEYLTNKPDFFIEHSDLLQSIELPHKSGRAVSLIERQVSVLRKRNSDMREQLGNLLESARANDQLLEKTKRLVLRLMDAKDFSEVVTTLYKSLATDYQLDYYSLIIVADNTRLPASSAKVVGLNEAQNQVGTLLKSNHPVCGVLRSEELEFLFGDKVNGVGSVAAVPLSHGQIYGILAIGNKDPNYYRSSMGTLFLSYIADVLNRILPPFIKK